MTLQSGNLFSSVISSLESEQFQDILNIPGVRIERIVSRGQVTSPGEWFDQAWDEWVLLVKGSAILRVKDESIDRVMTAGDYIYLPAGCLHRVEWTDPEADTVWLALHISEK